jgi:hypothetical protein
MPAAVSPASFDAYDARAASPVRVIAANADASSGASASRNRARAAMMSTA